MNEMLAAWPIMIALIITGVFAGLLAGLLGVGGGIVIVPVLYFLLQLFDVSPESAIAIATATSLAMIVPTSISSIRAHYIKGNVDVNILKSWGGFVLTFAILGSLAASNVPGNTLTLLFAIIAVVVSINMLFRAGASALFNKLPGRFGQSIMASSIGGLSVMISIGGGTIGVPLLTLFNVAAHKAVGTAAAFGLLIALLGVVTLLAVGGNRIDAPIGTIGLVNLPAFLLIIPLTIIFAPIGAKIGAKLNSAQLKKAFGIVLFITGVRMLLQIFGI